MIRVPVVATLIVGLAIAAMIGLGFWQLHRLDEKRQLLAIYATNEHLPPIALPSHPDDGLLFHRVTANCERPANWRREAGRSADGGSGWRQLADCAGSANNPGVVAQLGIATQPNGAPTWSGGAISGYLSHAPNHTPLIAQAFDRTPPRMMLVADTPLAGLKPNPVADLDAVPNNHLAYAVQWFVFAAIAAIIYPLALRRRMRGDVAPLPLAG